MAGQQQSQLNLEARNQKKSVPGEVLAEVLADLQQKNEQLKQELSLLVDRVKAKDIQIEELREQLLVKPSPQHAKISPKRDIQFKWREANKTLRTMHRSVDAVVGKKKVYFRCALSQEIHAYHFDKGTWTKLPKAKHSSTSIAIVHNFLTTIGGSNSNELLSLNDEDGHPKWIKIFPPMPSKRSKSLVLNTASVLIVAGGDLGIDGLTTKVEIMNTSTQKWFTAADLPEAVYSASGTVCGDNVYILGGWLTSSRQQTVLTCSLSALLLSASVSTTPCVSNVWSTIQNLPVVLSTCVSFNGDLLAFGGRVESKTSDAVYVYKPASDSWAVAGHMPTARERCFVNILPNGEILVVGGFRDGQESDVVEIGTPF